MYAYTNSYHKEEFVPEHNSRECREVIMPVVASMR